LRQRGKTPASWGVLYSYFTAVFGLSIAVAVLHIAASAKQPLFSARHPVAVNEDNASILATRVEVPQGSGCFVARTNRAHGEEPACVFPKSSKQKEQVSIPHVSLHDVPEVPSSLPTILETICCWSNK
jgi:hypothetical protein